jgi:phosphoribosylformylglycinamidine (FGAM) synthase-like amidotransferase family enzyme
LGLLPDHKLFGDHAAALLHNSTGKFSNHWVRMTVNTKINSPFLVGLKTLSAPVRHGEGKLFVRDDINSQIDQFACLTYEKNFNGSLNGIAGLTNKSGNVFGLMPHPEAYVNFSQHPAWTEWQSKSDAQDLNLKMPDGLSFFQNAFNALN